MLRFLRITGVVVFALIVGFSANVLKDMHTSGELFDAYNSNRKATLTLLAFSTLAVAVLSYIEWIYIRRRNSRKRYGAKHFEKDAEAKESGLDSTSIYAAPKSIDDWKGRKVRASKSYKNEPVKTGEGFWVGLLRIICLVLPFLYAGLLIYNLRAVHDDRLLGIILLSIFAVLLVLSMITVFGILQKKNWGLTCGYLLAICNLVIFPYGTAVGLFLLIGLAGSSQSFAVAKSHKRRSRSGSGRKSRAAAV